MKKMIFIIPPILVVISLCFIGLFYYFVDRPNIKLTKDAIIYIGDNYSFNDVIEELTKVSSITNERTLRCVASVKKYPQLIKSGRYRIKDGMSNNQLVNLLRSGQQEAVSFIFNNIRNLEDFAACISKQLKIDSVEFMEYVRNPQLLEKIGFTSCTIMGMFIPNTYQMYWNISLHDFIERMHKEYIVFWNKNRVDKSKALGLSPIEVITLASIVEEETNNKSEYPIIAGVYINRLNKGWKLEACPTLKFALNNYTLQRILDKHLEIESPYNTYKNFGLPPGPIRMPSPITIDSVLNAQNHKYMFFCAKSDFSGSHHFSRTLSEHNRYAKEYHKALNERKIYK